MPDALSVNVMPLALFKVMDRYLLRQIVVTTIIMTGVGLAILLLERVLRLFSLVADPDQALFYVGQMLILLTPHYLSLALPAAFFFGVLLTFLRLERDNELVLFMSVGNSLGRLLTPVMALAMVMTLITIGIVGYLTPHARYGYRAIKQAVAQASLSAAVREGTFIHAEGLTFYADSSVPSEEGLRLRKVFVYQEPEEGVAVVTTGEHGMLGEAPGSGDPVLFLEGGVRTELPEEGDEATTLTFRNLSWPALEAKVLVLTGGPGTGKTTLLRSLIDILDRKGVRLLLAAPTGRAAKRMAETTGRAAKTIHRLLEFAPREGRFKRNEFNPLQVDFVVVDEASMIDIVLMNHLLAALPSQASLLLLGDADQLPSVGPGSMLQDLIASGCVPVVRLTEIFRQAKESWIVLNAHRVNRGEFPHLLPFGATDFAFIEIEDAEAIRDQVRRLVTAEIASRYGLNPLLDIQVISPMNRGPLGVAALNQDLQAALNPKGEEILLGGRQLRVGDRVMQVRNNYDKEVYNGDLGWISRIDREDQQLWVRFDQGEILYDWSEHDELSLAYAISVHKSQGSEYPAVVFPLHTSHYIMLQRNLLYTTLSRGRRLVVMVGTRQALAIAVRNARLRERHSLLPDRLRRHLSGPAS